ncbi:MAG: serine/threonine-protein kinase [Limisphaerales bacterium]
MADEQPTANPGLPESEASAYLAAGFLVGGGRFSLLRELGRGGMGLVWLARDERLMAPVALKFLPGAVRANSVALNDLRQETQKSRMLSHPNILRIYDLYEAPGEPAFISMEYVDGPSLWTLLARQPKGFFYWDYLRPIVNQLCEALDYAHSEGVIHRDLKPANMLLDERQRLRLADFGVASWAFASPVHDTERHRTSGTPAYMSPQQIEGKVASVTDDIYALGATLYELLSGHPPFYQNDIGYQVRTVLATPLSERLADLEVENDVPPAVAAMIMACLSKNPEKRPQSARAVADWIGLTDSTAPIANFDPAVFNAPAATPPAKELRKTTSVPLPAPAIAAPTARVLELAPTTQIDAPPITGENPTRRRLVMLAGSAALGLLAWLAWEQLIPKMPDFPTGLSAPRTNTASSPGVIAGTAAATPAPSVAPAPVINNVPVSIELGVANREKGLREVTGVEDLPTLPANIGGKECRRLQGRPRARCYFQILPAFKHPGLMNARVQVEFYAVAPGMMQIQFDGSAREMPQYTGGGRTNFEGGANWQTATFKLNKAVFRNGERGGADFRLTTSSRELYLHSVIVLFDK